jgi:hypothetical protein
MFALPVAWQVVRTIGVHAARGLAAVEPRSWNRRAQRNAASAAASSRAWRLEAEDVEPWGASRFAADPARPGRSARVRATRG